MNLNENIRRCVESGKTLVSQRAVVARHMVGRVTTEAARQVGIAKPIVQRAVSMTQQLNCSFLLAGKLRLALVAGLIGAIALTGSACRSFSESGPNSIAGVDGSKTPADSEGVPQPAADIPGTEDQPSEPEVVQTSSESSARNFTVDEMQQDSVLEQQRLQVQAELEQAAAEYDYAVQQWNAEVAACQSGPAFGYTANQMGRFAAMGITVNPQPQRQPNQALFHAACQAEQRFVQARDNGQQFGGAQ